MASLAIALESELGQPVLLNDWIASAPSLSDLTVQSLAAHMAANLEAGGLRCPSRWKSAPRRCGSRWTPPAPR